MLVSILFFPMVYGKFQMAEYGEVAYSFSMFDFARVGESSFFVVLICAIGLFVSTWIPNEVLAKPVRLILQTGFVGTTLYTVFDKVWSGQWAHNLGSGAEVGLEWGLWIICLGFIIALFGTLVPKETPEK